MADVLIHVELARLIEAVRIAADAHAAAIARTKTAQDEVQRAGQALAEAGKDFEPTYFALAKARRALLSAIEQCDLVVEGC